MDEALYSQEEPPRAARIANAEAEFLRRLRKNDIYRELTRDWPPALSGAPTSWEFDAEVIWDSLEYFHAEVVSAPAPDDFDREAGRKALRQAVNPDLALFVPPMELTAQGHVVERRADEFHDLLDAPVSEDLPAPLRDPLAGAIEQYRRRGATPHDKRSALKHLADVLEPLRRELDQLVLPADESALFQIANKFWLRHNDRTQQRDYDTDIWLDWMFYVYVATARALLAVIDRETLADLVSDDYDPAAPPF